MHIHTLPLLIDRHEHLWEIIVRFFDADNNNNKKSAAFVLVWQIV